MKKPNELPVLKFHTPIKQRKTILEKLGKIPKFSSLGLICILGKLFELALDLNLE